ncbi:hypothetical protein J19TS2_38950 [Cohnella xylanilytica]|uniref:RCC1 domain-containing protein n=1 Tax=Cohnella xylanilytica TaxID=557555 RepID=UPI001B07C50C|nr:RCC1 repeat- and reductase domain-containing protein [Cohnella xylanilytica]GIO14340.1 hypothetical protein J19TS2_38950 [Cohnella xylanilytica]
MEFQVQPKQRGLSPARLMKGVFALSLTLSLLWSGFGERNYAAAETGTEAPISSISELGSEYAPTVQSAKHNVALKKDGTIWVWGSNGSGELGLGDTKVRKVPVQVTGPIQDIPFKQVDAGIQFTVALAADGTVWAWGQNSSGELGDGTTTRRLEPVQVRDPSDPSGYLTGVKQIQGGSSQSVALKEDGSVYTWGNNQSGQLGVDRKIPLSLVPLKVPNLPPIVNIVVSNGYTMAIDEAGVLWAWGEESYGQLGIGTIPSSTVLEASFKPIKVHAPDNSAPEWADVDQIAAGVTHVLALKDGKVYAWGNNLQGALGIGNSTRNFSGYPIPVQDPGDPSGQLSDVKAIAAGWDQSYAIKNDGTVVAWGVNLYGQLGNGTNQSSKLPVPVKWDNGSPFDGAVAVTAGFNFGLLLREDGTLWAMGNNAAGQLGNDGKENSYKYPVPVKL